MRHRVAARLWVAAACGVFMAGCTVSADSDGPAAGSAEVTLLADESWSIPDELREAFERQTDIELVVRTVGADAAGLTGELIRTGGAASADVAFGVDSSTAQRALAAGVFDTYTSPEANKGQQRYSIDDQQRLSAVDLVEVCVNVDVEWFAKRNVPVPETYADLAEDRYSDLFVLPSPVTSSQGFAFLLGSIERFGETGWQEYWSELKSNGVRVLPGFDDAYKKDFTGSSKDGNRPIALGYASSPAKEVDDNGDPTTKALRDTCYQTVRYAGVLEGADHPLRAQKFVDFLLSQQFQANLAERFGTYPVREGVELPDGWDQVAPPPANPKSLPAEEVDDNRTRWVTRWRSVMED